MKQTKYRYFRAILVDGVELDFKTSTPVTEGYAFMNTAHLLSKQYQHSLLLIILCFPGEESVFFHYEHIKHMS